MTGRVRQPLPQDPARRAKILRDRARRARQRQVRLSPTHDVPIYRLSWAPPKP